MPQARNEFAEYKKYADEVVKGAHNQIWNNTLTGNSGVYISPSAGTTTSYAANSLVTR